MHKKLFVVPMAMALGLTVASRSPIVFAQAVQDAPPQVDTTTRGTTATPANENEGVNWLWFLPLLLIPVVLLLSRDRHVDDTSEYRHHRFAGTKGGEARRKARERDLEEIEYDDYE